MPSYTAKATGGTLRGSNQADTITGSAVNDTLWGLGGSDIINGGDGNDIIEGDGAYTVADAVRETGMATVSNLGASGSAMLPTLISLGQIDGTLSVWAVRNITDSAMTVTLQSASRGSGSYGPVTIVVPAHSDVLLTSTSFGTHRLRYNGTIVDSEQASPAAFTNSAAYGVTVDGDDILNGGNGNDTIRGYGGNDTLDGGNGNDSLDGGSGDDLLNGGTGSDVLIGGTGTDTVTYQYATAGVALSFSATDSHGIGDSYTNRAAGGYSGDANGDSFAGIEIFTGSSYRDFVGGGATAMTFNLGAGDDVFDTNEAYSVADIVNGEAGNDTAWGGSGNDQLFGGAGDDSLSGEADNDRLSGGDGADRLYGGAGDDILSGGAGADVLSGDAGADTADYAASAAGVTVNLATGAGTGGDAQGDTLTGIENLTGSKFDDVLTGSAGANTLDGGEGNDVLMGSAGADIIIGGSGTDMADYSGSSAGVYINLATGVNSGGDAEGDTLIGIENLRGTAFDDILIGSAETTILDGGSGNDILDYSLSTAGITVNLTTSLAFGGYAEGDVITNFENLRGSASTDQLFGTSAVNDLFGGEGNDTMFGYGGMDRIYGGAGNDTLAGGAEADLIDGGDGSDIADYSGSTTGVFVNLLTGGNSDGDTFVSIEGVTGSAFDDVITGNAGANWLAGGFGIDTLDYSASNTAIAINLTSDMASGGHAEGDVISGFENVLGSIYNDNVTGNELANTIFGDAGDDMLQGFAGDDTLRGGAGNDRIYGGEGADVIDGDAGVDTADYRYSIAGVTVSLVTNTGTGGDAEGDTLSGIENLAGSNFDDILTGDAGNNRLVGNQGSDTLYGGAGNDIFDTGGGYDIVYGGDGVDTVTYDDSWGLVVVNLATGTGSGAEAADDVYFGVENVEGSAFADRITGDANVNRLTGLAGDDTLDGGAGNDILVGGAGADTLIGGAGTQDAASYQDALLGVVVSLALGGTGGEAAGDTYNGVEFVYGSAFNDLITGDGSINRLTGGAGDDTLDGAAGNDYILGDAGNDTLIGGLGADVFVFEMGFGNDTISDFWTGVGRTDRAWLTGLGFDDFADVQANAADTAAGVVITLAGEGTLTFTGITLAQLNADDFIFS